MAHLWQWFTEAVWPNLAASFLWSAPLVTWHHVRVRRRLAALHGQVAAIHAHVKTVAVREPPAGRGVSG